MKLTKLTENWNQTMTNTVRSRITRQYKQYVDRSNSVEKALEPMTTDMETFQNAWEAIREARKVLDSADVISTEIMSWQRIFKRYNLTDFQPILDKLFDHWNRLNMLTKFKYDYFTELFDI
uniref:Uncharacterized protein n=1 Tax=Cacopsylla melanoneura TaxID=428564 RepID=A0A8D9ABT0_9HEMI